MTTLQSRTLPWYHYDKWPEWVRWASVPVLPPIGAVIVYVVSLIINSFMTGLPKALVAVAAICMASGFYVLSSAALAPRFRRLVAIMFTSIVVATAVWIFASTVLGKSHSTSPVWYDIVVTVVATIGAIAGAMVEFEKPEIESNGGSRFLPRMPHILRWLFAVPIAFILSAAIAILELLIEQSVGINHQLVLVVNNIALGVLFAAVLISIAPRGKVIIGGILGGLWALYGVGEIIGTLIRSLFAAALQANASAHGYIMANDPAWYLILQGFTALVAGYVIFVGSRQAAKDQCAAVV